MLLEILIQKTLTHHEIYIVELISMEEITEHRDLSITLDILPQTLDRHLNSIYKKLNLGSIKEIEKFCRPYIDSCESPFSYQAPKNLFLMAPPSEKELAVYQKSMVDYLFQDTPPGLLFVKQLTPQASIFYDPLSNLLISRRSDAFKTFFVMSLIKEKSPETDPQRKRYVGYGVEKLSTIEITYFSNFAYFDKKNTLTHTSVHQKLTIDTFKELVLQSEYLAFLNKQSIKKKVNDLK